MIRRVLLTLALLAWSWNALPNAAVAQFRVQEHKDGVRVYQGDELIADYLIHNGAKPIVWPLIGPGGVKMTRDYPMVPDSKGEAHDHPHHRSLWFTHGDINGIDFWAEGEKMGRTEHQKFTKVEGGKTAVIATENAWKGPDGKTVLTDKRRYTFSAGPAGSRYLDCEFRLIASEGDLTFGDTKEGTFGVRVNEQIKVDAKKGGQIVTSTGLTDAKAWGQEADWVDYHGPIDGKTVGIAILSHPTTFDYPNRWHVRTYGLFAANPFGVAHFTGEKVNHETKVEKGESLPFRYRVILHEGDEKEAKIADQFKVYAAEEFGSL